MRANDLEDLELRVADVASSRPEVLLVYLFGSQVTGHTGPLSDTDLAVLLTRDAAVAMVRSELEHAFAEALDWVPVDLVVLNQAPIELAYAVIAQGRLLYERAVVDRVEYEADVLSRYGDYLPFLRAQREAILRGADDGRRVQRYREALGRIERALGSPDAPTEPPSD